MKTIRWGVAAGAIFGGLTAIAIAFYVLLVMSGYMAAGEEYAAIYWMCALAVILFGGAWLLLIVWCYVDAERRGMNGPLWALLVFVLQFPIGPLLYLVLRQPAISNGATKSDPSETLLPPM
jgi:hypothetical protein